MAASATASSPSSRWTRPTSAAPAKAPAKAKQLTAPKVRNGIPRPRDTWGSSRPKPTWPSQSVKVITSRDPATNYVLRSCDETVHRCKSDSCGERGLYVGEQRWQHC